MQPPTEPTTTDTFTDAQGRWYLDGKEITPGFIRPLVKSRGGMRTHTALGITATALFLGSLAGEAGVGFLAGMLAAVLYTAALVYYYQR